MALVEMLVILNSPYNRGKVYPRFNFYFSQDITNKYKLDSILLSYDL